MEGVSRQLLGIGAILFGIAVSMGQIAGIVFGLVGFILVLSGWEHGGRRRPAPPGDGPEDRDGPEAGRPPVR